MALLKTALPILLLFGGLSACTEAANTSDPTEQSQSNTLKITGQIGYRERIALSPGAVAEIKLQDISIADRPAPVLAEQTLEFDGQQIPWDFELNVESDELEPRGRYSVRAMINDRDGHLMFTSDTANIVQPGEGDVDLGLILLRQNTVSQEKTEDDDMWVYRCGDTNAAIVQSEDMIRLKVDGTSYDLPRVPSASGEKYEADLNGQMVMFWSKGERALLKIGETSYPECQA
ncbi:YbaY family lipoprotein [Litorimonas sp.]|uniref:YbaY family lipoprotein n=1 Tax=Litorimonas sp. TaxID=1892381 RepID=UPI003A86B376